VIIKKEQNKTGVNLRRYIPIVLWIIRITVYRLNTVVYSSINSTTSFGAVGRHPVHEELKSVYTVIWKFICNIIMCSLCTIQEQATLRMGIK
jgi:hypothetical protein